MLETLVYHGGEVKALGDGKVGGWLVVFGDPETTDLSPKRDYFTKATELGPFKQSVVLYHHGKDPELGPIDFGMGTLETKDAGVWIEAQLKAREGYEGYVQAMYELATKGKLGWSSGVPPHLVERKAMPNGSHEITRWPLGLDASLTPSPTDPRATAVAIKALDSDTFETFENMKGKHLGEHVEAHALMSAMQEVGGHLHRKVYDTLVESKAEPHAKRAAVKAMLDEHSETCMKCVDALIRRPTVDAAASVKAILDSLAVRLASGLTMATQGDAVVSAVDAYTDRLSRRHEARKATGRAISVKDRERISALKAKLDGLLAADFAPAAQEVKSDGFDLYNDFLATEARLSGALAVI